MDTREALELLAEITDRTFAIDMGNIEPEWSDETVKRECGPYDGEVEHALELRDIARAIQLVHRLLACNDAVDACDAAVAEYLRKCVES